MDSESDWRFAVPAFYMVGSRWRLASRILGGTPVAVVAYEVGATVYGLWRIFPASLLLPIHLADVTIPPAHPHFPYGLDVLPD